MHVWPPSESRHRQNFAHDIMFGLRQCQKTRYNAAPVLLIFFAHDIMLKFCEMTCAAHVLLKKFNYKTSETWILIFLDALQGLI